MYKVVLFVCGQALIQSISAQCIGAYNELAAVDGFGWGGCEIGAPFGTGLLAAPCDAALTAAPFAGPYADAIWDAHFAAYPAASLAASHGRGLMVTSASPIAPTGVSLTSENAYEGILAVSGAAPFLGAVALEGLLPSAGAGTVTYGCGNGEVAIVREDITPAYGAIAGPLAYDSLAPGYGGPLGYDGAPGYAGYGYGACAGPRY